MKKIKMTLAALLCCAMTTAVFTACTNDDNPAMLTSAGVSINVETAPLYEELGLTEYILKGIADGRLLVTDTVMIYNAEGNLVCKLGSEVDNLQPQRLQIKDLDNGTYTIVAWECVIGRKTGIRCWELVDEEQLSTVNIISPYTSKALDWAVGMTTSTINIDGGNVQVDIAPKPMGSIVEMKLDGFTEEKDYTEIRLFAYKGRATGFYLDPKRTDDDRWIVNNQQTDFIGRLLLGDTSAKFFTLCNDDDVMLYIRDINDKTKIAYHQHTNLHAGDQKVYYCDFDVLNWQPPFFGTQEDFGAWKADRDAGILVLDPCLKWGGNISDVEQHIKTKQWWVDRNEGLTNYNDIWYRLFWVAYKIREYYYFKTEDGQNLSTAWGVITDPTITIETINASLMKQGYTYVGVYNNPPNDIADVFISQDGQTEVMTYYSSEGNLLIYYQPTDPNDFQYITN